MRAGHAFEFLLNFIHLVELFSHLHVGLQVAESRQFRVRATTLPSLKPAILQFNDWIVVVKSAEDV